MIKPPRMCGTSPIPTDAMAALAHAGSLVVLNALDWSFDALNRSAPSFFVLGGRGNNWQSKTIAATSFVGGYLALACYSSP